jgi:hypothetical protein
MLNKVVLFGILSFIVSCRPSATEQDGKRAVANQFIDAFYSFNTDSLKVMLAQAPGSQPEILYYQKWAECAHYRVLQRTDIIVKNDSLVLCPITLKDDLMAALHINFNVTDTFHVTIKSGQIISVKTSSNDPKEYYDAKAWVQANRPELIEKQCEGIWNGGPTPCECVQGMLAGFRQMMEAKKEGAK